MKCPAVKFCTLNQSQHASAQKLRASLRTICFLDKTAADEIHCARCCTHECTQLGCATMLQEFATPHSTSLCWWLLFLPKYRFRFSPRRTMSRDTPFCTETDCWTSVHLFRISSRTDLSRSQACQSGSGPFPAASAPCPWTLFPLKCCY